MPSMGIQQAGYGESPNEKFPPINDSFKNKQTVHGTDKFPHRRVELRSSVLSGKYGFAPRDFQTTSDQSPGQGGLPG